MIKVGDKYLRNLEEQVQYLTNYHDVNQGLVQWGIRVVGQVETESELPLPYDGEYGDAIAVGTQAPFFFYIWTRASIEGNPAYWFPFGEISIVGPEGPVGPRGEKGDRGDSTRIVATANKSFIYPEYHNIGDFVLITGGEEIGNLYIVITLNNQKTLSLVGNIRGPQGIQGVQGPQGPQGIQGIQGPKGDTGDVGGFINIYGILTNSNQLPNPDTLKNRTIAYLIGTGFPYDLYIQVGDADGPVMWVNSGPLNVSTLVFANGEAQNTWNADTKVDKVVPTNADVLYGQLANGNNWNPVASKIKLDEYVIPLRSAQGNLTVPLEPSADNMATSKKYVDDGFVAKPTETSGFSRLFYVKGSSLDTDFITLSSGTMANTVAQRTTKGRLLVGTPEQYNDATNKAYVDEKIAALEARIAALEGK